MEYRKLPHGGENERFSVLGIGIGGIQSAGGAEIVNWARAILSLMPTKIPGMFRLCAGKRGQRLGWEARKVGAGGFSPMSATNAFSRALAIGSSGLGSLPSRDLRTAA